MKTSRGESKEQKIRRSVLKILSNAPKLIIKKALIVLRA